MTHWNKRRLVLSVLALLAAAVLAMPVAAQPPTATNSMGTVMARGLNVREGPGTEYGILTVIAEGEVFPVVGRTPDGGWWELLMSRDGATGWVSGTYLNVAYQQGVPVTHAAPRGQPLAQPRMTNSIGTVMARALNVREGPGTHYAVISVLSRGEVPPVVGRTVDGRWWELLLNPEGATGWVSGNYLNVAYPQGVPVTYRTTGASPQPVHRGSGSSVHYWTIDNDVNIRSGPGTQYSIIGGLFGGLAAQATGRNTAGTWVQIRTDIGVGWITASVLPEANLGVLPIVG